MSRRFGTLRLNLRDLRAATIKIRIFTWNINKNSIATHKKTSAFTMFTKRVYLFHTFIFCMSSCDYDYGLQIS